MTVYLDTGVFIDLLVGRSLATSFLRTTSRRGRPPAQLGTDAEECFRRLQAHTCLTSSLTYFEVEDAAFRAMKRSLVGTANGARTVVPSARGVMNQTLLLLDHLGVGCLDLTGRILRDHAQDHELQRRGVRAADSLHITTALLHDTDLFLSTDKAILSLDGVLRTASGKVMRFLDTDAALPILERVPD